jgi:hypothetical protein
VYIARYKIKQEVKMNKRINYISHLFITSSVYKVLVDINIGPTDAKNIIDAIEKGIDHANAYDEELNKGVK